MYTKEQFKQRFQSMSTEELIENQVTRQLTDEARQATREILAERDVQGDALKEIERDVRRDLITRPGATNQCDHCGKNVLLAPVRRGNQKFCSEGCSETSRLLVRAVDLTQEAIRDHAVAARAGTCPSCRRRDGTVEMRRSFHLLSAVFYRISKTDLTLSCRTCARKRNLWAALECAVLGWWSPSGLFRTPYYIGRNIVAMFDSGRAYEPSTELLYWAKLDLARRMPDMAGVA